MRFRSRVFPAAVIAVASAACSPAARSPAPQPAPLGIPSSRDRSGDASPPKAGLGRERISLDRGFRFALGHATNPARDFGHGTSYFSYLAKAGFGDGPADPNFDDRGFRDVDLPHDWAVELPFDEKGGHSHGYKALGRSFPENSVGWYRRELEIGEEDRGRRIVLEFDGIFRDSLVFVNGFLVGREPSGYASAHYDVSLISSHFEGPLTSMGFSASAPIERPPAHRGV